MISRRLHHRLDWTWLSLLPHLGLLPLLMGAPLGTPMAAQEESGVEHPSGLAAGAQVQFSDGSERSGVVELTQALQVHDGTTMRSIPPDQVAEIELLPLSEAVVQGWRFVEPGQPRKEDVGKPYPVRHLEARITTISGERIRGHLTTTVAWLTPTPDSDRERIILPAKQEGDCGETLAALVYPVRLVLAAHPHQEGGTSIQLPPAPAGSGQPAPALVVIARGSLARSEAVASPTLAGRYQLPGPLEAPAFIARGGTLALDVGWPQGASAADTTVVQQAVDQAQDFLDHRQLLGVWAEGDDQLYGLLLLYRQGPTTMAGPDHPWRLEVWRWKHEGAHLLWAARAYCFRGLAANVAGLPTVHLHAAWWSQTITDGVLTLAEDPHGR